MSSPDNRGMPADDSPEAQSPVIPLRDYRFPAEDYLQTTPSSSVESLLVPNLRTYRSTTGGNRSAAVGNVSSSHGVDRTFTRSDAPSPQRTPPNLRDYRPNTPPVGIHPLFSSVPSGLAFPSPELSFELRANHRNLKDTEKIDQTRYAKLEADIGETGYLPWILMAYDDEKTAQSRAIGRMTQEHWVRGCDYTLAGTIPEVLNILAKRESLAKASRNDKALSDKLKEYGEMAADRFPSIYVRQLVVGPDHDDITVEQAKAIAMFIRQYANAEPSEADKHYKIDKLLHPEWRRAYTDAGARVLTHDKNHATSKGKTQVLQTFGDMIEKNAQNAATLGHTHIPTMYYVGYAQNAAVLADDRAKNDRSTNGLFNLVEYLLEGWGAKSEALTFPVCIVLTHMYADIAEMFLCRLAQGYFYAGGYNQAPCGDVDRTWSISEREWMAHRELYNKKFDYVKMQETELEKRTAFQRRDWDANIARLTAEEKRLMDRELEVRAKYMKLKETLDVEYMRNHPFLSKYVHLWDELEAFVKSGSTQEKPDIPSVDSLHSDPTSRIKEDADAPMKTTEVKGLPPASQVAPESKPEPEPEPEQEREPPREEESDDDNPQYTEAAVYEHAGAFPKLMKEFNEQMDRFDLTLRKANMRLADPRIQEADARIQALTVKIAQKMAREKDAKGKEAKEGEAGVKEEACAGGSGCPLPSESDQSSQPAAEEQMLGGVPSQAESGTKRDARGPRTDTKEDGQA
ncbi:hypothetical protein OPT61_g6311 [Boeremia exigua]|uniref:Uncharacterized protein n=1 Tax=Boeremia exigua TaxID=749465 RepID=A0ACC2I719_9PLEO|nr:hypothetical protein OPT61_g6311 [Boeremia exigua]